MVEAPARAIMEDWITICQSEMSAAATDRDRARAWSALVGTWADLARLAWPAASAPGGGDDAAGPATPAAPAGASPARDAPGPGHAELERLAERVAELERRLAERG